MIYKLNAEEINSIKMQLDELYFQKQITDSQFSTCCSSLNSFSNTFENGSMFNLCNDNGNNIMLFRYSKYYPFIIVKRMGGYINV